MLLAAALNTAKFVEEVSDIKYTNNFDEIKELEDAIRMQTKVARAKKDHESNALLQRLLETRTRLIREQRQSFVLLQGGQEGGGA